MRYQVSVYGMRIIPYGLDDMQRRQVNVGPVDIDHAGSFGLRTRAIEAGVARDHKFRPHFTGPVSFSEGNPHMMEGINSVPVSFDRVGAWCRNLLNHIEIRGRKAP